MQQHGFYFVCEHHGQTPTDLESVGCVSEAAGRHSDPALRSAPLEMGAVSVKYRVKELDLFYLIS